MQFSPMARTRHFFGNLFTRRVQARTKLSSRSAGTTTKPFTGSCLAPCKNPVGYLSKLLCKLGPASGGSERVQDCFVFPPPIELTRLNRSGLWSTQLRTD